jgi:4-hydroxy-4-methyl-2-oxoglutarate aldolase
MRKSTEAMPAEESNLERLSRLDCCAISDALDKLELSGVVTGLAQLSAPRGILTLGAQLRGVADVVADGPVRDIDEAGACDFPIYGRSCTSRTARGRIVELGTQVAIRIGDVEVLPGDYVIADGSAVIFIHAGNLAAVLDSAELISAKEAAMADALRAGRPISEVMGADYEHLLS